VEIDLRHVGLDPDEWGMELIGTSSPEGITRSSHWPFIWFPWYGKFDKAAIWRDLENSALRHGHKLDKATKAIMRWMAKDYIPDVFVYEGDKIEIDRVERISCDRPFAHLHDREKRAAYLRIKRKNGRYVQLSKPIHAVGHSSIFYLEGLTLENIMPRIFEKFGLNSLDDPKTTAILASKEASFAKEDSFARESLLCLKLLMDREKDTIAIAKRLHFRDPEGQAAHRIAGAIEDALRIGYFWANAEAAMKMEPLARSGLEVHKGAKKAGIESGNKRRAKADETWKPHALELAQKLREADPGLSQHRLADEISFKWKLDHAAPGHTTLTSFISQLEKAGTLPRRANDESSNERRSFGQTNGA
jgi:hypothetical protein